MKKQTDKKDLDNKKKKESNKSSSALAAASVARNPSEVKHDSRKDISGSRRSTVNTGPIVDYEDEK